MKVVLILIGIFALIMGVVFFDSVAPWEYNVAIAIQIMVAFLAIGYLLSRLTSVTKSRRSSEHFGHVPTEVKVSQSRFEIDIKDAFNGSKNPVEYCSKAAVRGRILSLHEEIEVEIKVLERVIQLYRERLHALNAEIDPTVTNFAQMKEDFRSLRQNLSEEEFVEYYAQIIVGDRILSLSKYPDFEHAVLGRVIELYEQQLCRVRG